MVDLDRGRGSGRKRATTCKSAAVQKIDHCPVCGSHKTDEWGHVRDGHYGNPGTWRIAACSSCDARFLDPMPDEQELGAFYPDNYYSFDEAGQRPQSAWRRRLLPLATKEPTLAAGRFLDVGCGAGWMLDEYRAKGWEVTGVEYSATAGANAAQRGLDVRVGSLHEAAFADASFDYVRLNHSFEHMADPSAVMDEIRRVLRPGGTLFIGVPDAKGLMARAGGRYWYYVGAPVHTITYNRTNLADLITRHGFALESVRANSNHGGTLGTLQMWLNRKNGRSIEQGRIFKQKPLMLVGLWASKLLDVVRLGDCVEVIARRPDAAMAGGAEGVHR